MIKALIVSSWEETLNGIYGTDNLKVFNMCRRENGIF